MPSNTAFHSFKSGPPFAGGDPLDFSPDKDRQYVKAVNAGGGFPTATGVGWKRADGKPWRGSVR